MQGVDESNLPSYLKVLCPCCGKHTENIPLRGSGKIPQDRWAWDPVKKTLTPSMIWSQVPCGKAHFSIIDGKFVIHKDSTQKGPEA